MSQLSCSTKLNNNFPDPRLQPENNVETMEETTSISSEIDHILYQEFEISTSLSELDFMLS